MRRLALALAPVVASGCFFTDPINERPSLAINQQASGAPFRGDTVHLTALADDPDGNYVDVQWAAYACTDATQTNGCDAQDFAATIAPDFTFTVPRGRDTRSVLVRLTGTDSLGAEARPAQQLVIPVANHPPVLEMVASPRYGEVIDTPIDVYLKVTDLDDDARFETPDWHVFSPSSNPAFETETAMLPYEGGDAQQWRYTVTPHGLGDWSVRATVADPFDASAQKDVALTVAADHAPCLAQWSPIAETGGAVLPITEDALFQVPLVVDDLDPYPTVGGDAILGATAFQWSIEPPGATAWQPLAGATGNSVPLAHDAYPAGSVVELRVEIQDRTHTPLTCAASEPTCSVISDSTCIQRQTWRVELH